MKISMHQFRTNKFFFFKYFSIQMLVSLLVLWASYKIFGIDLDYVFNEKLLIFLPFTFIIGLQIPVILHNTVHFNIKNRMLNEIVGEMCGSFVLFGMAPFRISHTLHHAYPDDKEKDTHPPEGKSFLHFVATTQINTINVISKFYFDRFGDDFKTRCIMIIQMVFYYVSIVAKIFAFYTVLGSELFVHIFIPAYLTNLFVFAHINYATHRKVKDGRMEIVNLNHNFYYKLVNFFGSGAYFHKNHHDFPKLYNPQSLESINSQPILNRIRSSIAARGN